MDYVWFSLGFVAIHLGAYIVAGAVSLRFTRDLYTGDGALFAPFLRDVATPEKKARQGLVMWPAQLARGLLMSVVLYPVLTPLAELPLAARFGFLTAPMFVYTDLAAATPLSNTIEGLVYMKKRFVRPDVFWRIGGDRLKHPLRQPRSLDALLSRPARHGQLWPIRAAFGDRNVDHQCYTRRWLVTRVSPGHRAAPLSCIELSR